jgi:predicted AlkP superfamily phosphohydrolase/phosphomutase
MFFLSLDRLRTGTLTCVFDATDRIQHMFWRYVDPGHPAAKGRDGGAHKGAVEAIYKHNDALVGRMLERLQKDDVLMVLSDHGFTSFRRGCNLNAWLHKNGYLALKPGATGKEEWLQGVDWSKTRAYALGLSGLFLNVKGREAYGIVEPGDEVARLKSELIGKLNGLRDADKGKVGIREAFDTWKLYQGPYLANAPDLIIGYDEGYRVSWDGATGVVDTPVFEDNVKAWSGDHCVDPRLVPGVFFCNHALDRKNPTLLDIAPTALRLFGVERPGHMEGEALFAENPLARRAKATKAA